VEKVLELKKEQTSGLFGDLYEKKDAKEASVKGDAVEPTLDSLAVSCKEALAEYLNLSRGLNSVFVLDREDFLQTKLNPAKKLFNERNKEFQRALLNDREIGMSLFSVPDGVQSYEEVAREICAKSVSPIPTILLAVSVVVLVGIGLLFSHRTVDAYILLEKWISLTILAGMLFSVGIFGSISALKSINKYSVVSTTVSRAYEERYKKQRGEAITESLRACISAEVLETIQRLCSAREFKLNKTLDYDVPYEAQASYLKDRELCKRLSRDSGRVFFDCIESLEPYKLISPRERLTVLQNYSTGNCDYSRIGNGESLFSHIDLVSDVVAMR
jgi:hypothetical protein